MKGVGLFFLLLFILPVFLLLQAQETHMYRLILKNKGVSPYSFNNPEGFLSPKSIERRIKQNIPLDSTDLPIDTSYLRLIVETGAEIRTLSKWVNTVTVQVSDSASTLDKLNALPFVDTLLLVWKGNTPGMHLNPQKSIDTEPETDSNIPFNDVNIYGGGYDQISILNGHLLHDAGYKGEGMTIAVLDGGFSNCDIIGAFDHSHILSIRNFTHKDIGLNPYRSETEHGTSVLSCMLSNQPGVLVGTAPKAEYHLIITEVNGEEFPVEEDYWIAGMEYADSLGVDVANTSLGYTTFDLPEMNHHHSDLDGHSTWMSRAATLASQKGILLFVAAGNEGSKDWKKISVPGDATEIITVGSVTYDRNKSPFSSIGPTADNRIKPDLMSMGSLAAIIDGNGNMTYSNGTSYASPILAGISACLWQALPDLTHTEIMEILWENADHYMNPDTLSGYGIPDVYKAFDTNYSGITPAKENPKIVYVKDNRLYITLTTGEADNCRIQIYSSLGMKVFYLNQLDESVDISFLPKGVYIAYIQCGEIQYMRKFLKF